jgi:hypothetical protein
MRKPWQVWVCTFALAIMLAAIWCDGAIQAIVQLTVSALYTMRHAPFGVVTLKVGLVLLVPALMISVAIAWVLSLISFLRGRPWGLIAAIGSLTVFVYVTIGAAIYVHVKGFVNFHYEFIGGLLLVIFGVGVLLLSNTVRNYCLLSHRGALFLITRGVLLGTTVSVGYIGSAYSVLLFVPWIKG